MQLPADQQISKLHEEHTQLEQEVGAIQDGSSRSIMKRISDFIKILLAFTINAFTSIEAIRAGMKTCENQLGSLEDKLKAIDDTVESVSTSIDERKAEHKKLIDHTGSELTIIKSQLGTVTAVSVHDQLSDAAKRVVALETQMGTLLGTVAQLQHIASSGTGQSNYGRSDGAYKKGIMEYKSISCLRPLKTKNEFRIWNETN